MLLSQMNAEVKEMVGTLTMAATFFITLLNVTILVANRNDTIVIRGLVNQGRYCACSI